MGRSTQTLIALLVAFTVLIAVLTIADSGGAPVSSSAAFPTPPATIRAAPTNIAPPRATTIGAAVAASPTTPATATVTDPTVSATAVSGTTPTVTTPAATVVRATPTATPRIGTAVPTTTVTTTPNATPATVAPSATIVLSATSTAVGTAASATVTTTLPSSGLAIATAPSGVFSVNSPPHYGVYYNYINNTPYLASYVQTLDRRIVALTNVQRTAQGLSTLVESDNLDIIAAARAQDMIARGYFSHYDPTGSVDATGQHAAAVQELLARNSVPYAEVGENLVNQSGGYAFNDATPAEVVTAFMHHPEHRANVLYPAYTAIGVGMALRQEADGLRVVIAQVFVR